MTRSGVFLSIFLMLGSICFSTVSHAEGFFEMLFAGSRQHTEAHTNYVLAPPLAYHHARRRHHVAAHHKKAPHYASRVHSRHHRVFAHHRAAPAVAQSQMSYAALPASVGAPADQQSNAQDAIAKVMHEDPTLRPGDAYMSADGLRVYEGDRVKDQEFVPVRQARALDKGSRARLAAVEKAPGVNNPASVDSKPRSASVPALRPALAPEQKPSRLNKERLIKTLSGKTIRFVGGYAG